MKKICFVMHRFAGGGAERITVLLANELCSKGYHVTFLVKYADGEFMKNLSECIEVKTMLHKKERKIAFFKNLKKDLFGIQYDCVFAVSVGMSLFAVLANAANKNKVRLIPVIHSTISKNDITFKRLKLFIMKKFDKYTYCTVAVSKQVREDYIKTVKVTERKVITIYNPVVSGELKEKMKMPISHEWMIEHECPVVVAAGRLTREKNYFLMLDAFKLVRQQKDARLIILGQGGLEEELRKYAKQEMLDAYVDFHGFEANPYAYFYNADCVLLTSNYEGLPTVLIEALACGCPVVSTDCVSGPREILDNGKYGYLVSVGDGEKIAEAVIKTLSERKYAKEVLQERAEVFSVANAVDQYVELIEGRL
jgi:glycosyltransferase involved in cell wall biosynthesis